MLQLNPIGEAAPCTYACLRLDVLVWHFVCAYLKSRERVSNRVGDHNVHPIQTVHALQLHALLNIVLPICI